MNKVKAWGATAGGKPLEPLTIERREPNPRDVVIDILFSGICHSDIHTVREEWGQASFPIVPGHEIVGRIVKVGSAVTQFAVGQLAGVGCMVNSCQDCRPCHEHTEQFCEKGMAPTYGGTEMDRKTPTQGGYSTQVVVDERFVLHVPENLDPAGVAPLLCAGITTYSPLRRFGVKKGDRVGVVGLGGLGHMAVKLAASMGAEVTVLSTTAEKEADARKLGATQFAVTKDPQTFKRLAGKLDLIIDTISAKHDYNQYLSLIRPHGEMTLVGAPPEPSPVAAFSLIFGNKRLAGSLIGGIKETQEMLEHCAKHDIVSDIEIIPIQKVNEAYDRVLKSDVRYRFVIDMASLRG